MGVGWVGVRWVGVMWVGVRWVGMRWVLRGGGKGLCKKTRDVGVNDMT